MIRNFLISIAVIFITAMGVIAEEETKIYPLPAVIISNSVDNSAFNKVFSNNQSLFISDYLQTIHKYFHNSIDSFSDKEKYKTYVAYVHVPRATEYFVSVSENLIDIYLPLTMSINFANMSTGEILYSYPMTNYFKYRTSKETDAEKRKSTMIDLCKQNYQKTLNEIVEKASVEFKPYDIETSIIDTYKETFVFDKGLESGITKSDILIDKKNNSLSVIYSDLGYSVAVKLLGKPANNEKYYKTTTTSISQLKKPKILFINDFNDEKLYNIFSTSFTNNADFSLITTDNTYYDMQRALISLNQEYKTRNAYNRALPDYFLKLYFNKPSYTQYKSDKAYFNVDKYDMIACGVIFDKTGRAVYSKCVDEKLVNKVVENIRFDDKANYEILAKNLLLKLAGFMQQDIKFNDITFKLMSINDDYITLSDNNGYLKIGNKLTIFKKIQTEKSGREIFVPTWEYVVIKNENGEAIARMSRPFLADTKYPMKKDIVKMTLMTRAANKANMFNYNPDKVEINGNEVSLNNFEQIAFAALASSLQAPIAMHPADFQNQIDFLNSLGFKEQIKIPENPYNLTIKTMYKIKLIKSEEKLNVLKNEYEITIGVISKKDGKTLKQDGVQQNVTIVIPKEKYEDTLQNELVKYIYPLIQQVASNF